MHQSATGGRKASAHLCRNDQRRHLGRIVRSVVRRIQGLVPMEVAGAVCGRPGALVRLPYLCRADRSGADQTDAGRRLFLHPAQRGHDPAAGRHHHPRRLAGAAGQAARLHIQIVSLFSVIAVVPAVVVAIVANVTIDRGLDRLFSGPTREVIQNSLIIARAYMQEHAQLIRGDILGMANDIAHARPLYDQDRQSFNELLTASAASRNLPGAMLIDKDRNVLATAQTGIQLAFAAPSAEFLGNVDETEPEIAVLPEENYVAAVIRLRAFNDTFLYVARQLDPRVVAQLRQTEASVAEYAEIESRWLGLQVNFALMFAVIALA